ncbi:methyltransferase N6AMT1 [Octopus sinensis]|uniref:Methyltransferase HEMK2 n=1 Tax=Octopus sinensis TaxID=2607531 RepID=A0A7E6FG92_9MOLL|nr:methyltransferase N6AMT1 [Octopus sinensis]
MFSTPNFSHISSKDYEKIYEPAEDTFLLLDAIEKDFPFIKNQQPFICVEIGCGSGVPLVFLARVLGPSLFYICTDINRTAVQIARDTAFHNDVVVEAVETDLMSGLLPRLSNKVDILLFNPPYVPTPSDDIKFNADDPVVASWAGGTKGREVMDRLFPLIPHILSETGILYLVVVAENDPPDILKTMNSYGLCAETVISRRSGPELLSVIRFTKKSIVNK